MQEILNKRYYSIGEVANMLGVNTSLIRFWEKEFTVLKPKKSANGNRKFTPEDIKTLKMIYKLVKEKGYTLDGAREYIKENKEEVLKIENIINKLNGIKKELLKLQTKI